MGDFFGKKSKRRQKESMNDMNAKIQEQVDMFAEERGVARDRTAQTRKQYEDFEFTNPYAGAQNVYAGAENKFAGLENQYEGMENRFEDMTVDMRAADFQAQQGQQQRANIMQGLRGAAGSSGVAGLAQSLANAGSMQSQQIAAGIGQQERQNQMLAAQEGSRIDMTQRGAGMQLQQMQAQGAMQTQQMQMGGAAQQQGMILEGAVRSYFGAQSDRRLKKNINKIGESPSGLNIYSFEYTNSKYGEGVFQGVMSDEIPQEAVINNGKYDMVNYSMLDVEFKQI